MDSDRFDRLAMFLGTSRTRRHLSNVLARGPIVAALLAFFVVESPSEAKRKRNKVHRDDPRSLKRGKHGKGRKRKHPRPQPPACSPESTAQICTGKCEIVPNNCGTPVDCGPCPCSPPCSVCETCDAGTRQCVTTPDGAVCGAGLECINGACVCTTTSCATGCCSGGTCNVDEDTACGTGGGACTDCTGVGICGGGGTPGECGCESEAAACAGKCGAVRDNCGSLIFFCERFCTGCCSVGTCLPGTERTACGRSHDTCQSCDGVCVNGSCLTCDATNRCPSGMCCSGGQCVSGCPECQRCNPTNGLCEPDDTKQGSVCDGTFPDTSICCNGECCDGCCGPNGFCGTCLVFITESPPSPDGNLFGLNGADAKCQALAGSGALPSPGSYKAWLSIGSGPNQSPASGRFRHSRRPYVLPDGIGTQVADNWEDLTSCASGACLDSQITVAENGAVLPPDPNMKVWTATDTNGQYLANAGTCNGWMATTGTGGVGDTSNPGSTWTAGGEMSCSTQARLYCFQQD